MIKAVIFDVDGVLLDSFEANFLFLEELFNASGFTPPTREEYKSLFHRPMRDVIRAVTNLTDEGKINEIWERGRSEEFASPDASLSPNVVKVVEELNKNYLLGIVTSRVRAHVFEGSLQSLRPYFKAVVSYEDTENHKPHPDPLLLAVRTLGVLPEEGVYVGDVENDVVAARAAGMKVVVYSRDGVAGADGKTTDFLKIPQIVKSL